MGLTIIYYIRLLGQHSSSYDKTEHMNVSKERPHRAVPASVCTPNPKLKPHSIIKGRKRGRNLDFERVVESPAKKNILDGKAEDVDFNLIHMCLKNATPPDDVDILNLGCGHIGGQSDNCCSTRMEEKVKGLT